MKIYTDGACSFNPGPGGYGVVIMDNQETKIIDYFSHQEQYTTNNIQELKALIHAFVIASTCSDKYFTIYSDSAYAINVFTQWAKKWKENNWTKSDNKEIKNLDLIIKGYEIFSNLSNCEVVKVKGHAENIGNEIADALAADNMVKFNKYLKQFELKN
jgi:ribonuclease HI